MHLDRWHHLQVCYYGITMRDEEKNMQTELNALIQAINDDYLAWQSASGKPRTEIQERMYDEFVQSVRVDEGSKYIKIVKQGSVWGFIVKTDKDKKFRRGDILKAASWAAPARNKARGNILDGGYQINWTGPNYL